MPLLSDRKGIVRGGTATSKASRKGGGVYDVRNGGGVGSKTWGTRSEERSDEALQILGLPSLLTFKVVSFGSGRVPKGSLSCCCSTSREFIMSSAWASDSADGSTVAGRGTPLDTGTGWEVRKRGGLWGIMNATEQGMMRASAITKGSMREDFISDVNAS